MHVTVGGTSIPMSAAGSRWSFGVTYTAKARFAEGTFDVLFEAHDSLGNGSHMSGGTVKIGPAAEPTSSPATTPRPQPEPAAFAAPRWDDGWIDDEFGRRRRWRLRPVARARPTHRNPEWARRPPQP